MNEKNDCAYRLIEAGAYINALASRGKRGRTTLQAAVSVGDVGMVEYLLSKGANVNAPAAFVNGVTALQAAAIKGCLPRTWRRHRYQSGDRERPNGYRGCCRIRED